MIFNQNEEHFGFCFMIMQIFVFYPWILFVEMLPTFYIALPAPTWPNAPGVIGYFEIFGRNLKKSNYFFFFFFFFLAIFTCIIRIWLFWSIFTEGLDGVPGGVGGWGWDGVGVGVVLVKGSDIARYKKKQGRPVAWYSRTIPWPLTPKVDRATLLFLKIKMETWTLTTATWGTQREWHGTWPFLKFERRQGKF